MNKDVSNELLAEASAALKAGGSVEDVLALLKANGVNAVGSIGALRRLLGIGSDEAQELLYWSECWKQMRRPSDQGRSRPDPAQ